MDRELSIQQRIWLWGRAWKDGIVALFFYLFMPALAMSVGYVILHPDMTAQEFFTYGGNFYTAVGMCLTIYFLYRRSRKKGSGFFEDATLCLEGVRVKKTAGFFVFGLAAAVCISALLSLLPRWGLMNAYSEASQNMFRGQDILFTLITTVITGPFVEEVVFRGYMLNGLLKTFGERTSLWMASAAFAICHGTALWILYALAMGYLLAWISVKEDNIFYCIVLHMGFNAVSGITWLIRSLPAASELLYESNWIIFGYGLAGGLVCALLAERYKRSREAWEENG